MALITCADAGYKDHLSSFNTHMYTCLRIKCPLLKYLKRKIPFWVPNYRGQALFLGINERSFKTKSISFIKC